MIDNVVLIQTTSLALLFVVFATGAYKKSFSTTAYIIAQAVSIFCYFNVDAKLAAVVLIVMGTLMVLRAMYHDEFDTLFKV